MSILIFPGSSHHLTLLKFFCSFTSLEYLNEAFRCPCIKLSQSDVMMSGLVVRPYPVIRRSEIEPHSDQIVCLYCILICIIIIALSVGAIHS